MEALAKLMRGLSFLACVSIAFFLAFIGRADESVDQRLEKILGQMTL